MQPLPANVLKITRFLVIRACLWVRSSYLCSGIPFHLSNWQTDLFHFEDRSYGTLLVYYWDFRDALRRKSLFFSGIFYSFVNKNKKRYKRYKMGINFSVKTSQKSAFYNLKLAR